MRTTLEKGSASSSLVFGTMRMYRERFISFEGFYWEELNGAIFASNKWGSVDIFKMRLEFVVSIALGANERG